MNAESKKEINSQSTKSNSLFEWYDSILKALIIILILITFLFKVCTVVGNSMNNTLYNNERIVISNFLYTPKENDIIVFHQTGEILNEPCVKRVIATGNKWVKIDYDNKILYVSSDNIFNEDDIVDESTYAFFDTDNYRHQSGIYEIYVPEGKLFVMGDNRNNSLDSRYSSIGLIDEKTVLGKVIFRIAPSDRVGTIN